MHKQKNHPVNNKLVAEYAMKKKKKEEKGGGGLCGDGCREAANRIMYGELKESYERIKKKRK